MSVEVKAHIRQVNQLQDQPHMPPRCDAAFALARVRDAIGACDEEDEECSDMVHDGAEITLAADAPTSIARQIAL